MVDDLETRIGVLDADAAMCKKQVKGAEEMMMNVRFYNRIVWSTFSSH